MNFEVILKNLIKNAVDSFNTGDYDAVADSLIYKITLINPAIKNDKVNFKEVRLESKEAVIKYWKDLNANYDNRITDIKFITVGKTSVVRCIYGTLEFTLDMEIQFDEYGKVIKIINHLISS